MRFARILPPLALVFGCSSAATDLTGTWSAASTVAGSALEISIQQLGDSISGDGTYAIEAGRAGTLQVVGTYQRPTVHVSLHYDYGRDAVYHGTVDDGSHITGTFDTGGSMTLVRR